MNIPTVTGRWDPDSQTWVQDDITSRCIDAGNPGSPLADEPIGPYNLRINMGAYGGTAVASKTPYNWSLLADLNNDGVGNLKDSAHQGHDWLQTAAEQPGDLNRDGTISVGDLILLVQDWLAKTSWYD